MRRVKINCQKCQHFFITWRKNYPYGCKAFNMESKEFPAKQVLYSSGEECLFFTPKLISKKNSQKTKPLNATKSLDDSSFDKKI